MRIGLIDTDGHNFPNLPLMKISTWHKKRGDTVEWYTYFTGNFDKVYVAKVFDYTPDYLYDINATLVVRGGTGYGTDSFLMKDIEHSYPDYSIYPRYMEAYGFLTRGCPRNCPFCIVSAKEGYVSHKVADLSEFWNGQAAIKLLDPNFLACKDREDLLLQLIDSKAYIDFTQGLDIRLISQDVIKLLKKCRMKTLHFAWDTEKDSDIVYKNLLLLKESQAYRMRDVVVYVLTNYDTSWEFDLHRIYTLRSLGAFPFVMIYNKSKADYKYIKLQSWTNNKILFSVCEKFEDYDTRKKPKGGEN